MVPIFLHKQPNIIGYIANIVPLQTDLTDLAYIQFFYGALELAQMQMAQGFHSGGGGRVQMWPKMGTVHLAKSWKGVEEDGEIKRSLLQVLLAPFHGLCSKPLHRSAALIQLSSPSHILVILVVLLEGT